MAHIIQQDGRWQISGDLLLADIETLLAQGIVISSGPALEIDLASVGEVDSAAISLLFDWVRQATERGCHLTYSNLPANLTSLATLYGVQDLLPVTPAPIPH